MVSMSTNECHNIASAIVINFEECNITLLETKILTQNHVDQQTIISRLNEIRTQSRSNSIILIDNSVDIMQPFLLKLLYFSLSINVNFYPTQSLTFSA